MTHLKRIKIKNYWKIQTEKTEQLTVEIHWMLNLNENKKIKLKNIFYD